MKVEIPDLTGVECGDIAVTAAEGGIGYWSQIISEYDWHRWAGPDATIGHGHPDNSKAPDDPDFAFYRIAPLNEDESGYDETKAVDVTPALIRLGFKRALAAPLDKGGWMANGLLKVAREDWMSEIDSDGADMLIQFGAFGELVYG